MDKYRATVCVQTVWYLQKASVLFYTLVYRTTIKRLGMQTFLAFFSSVNSMFMPSTLFCTNLFRSSSNLRPTSHAVQKKGKEEDRNRNFLFSHLN